LQEIRDIFKDLKLTFYLVDGALLGAVREKNFLKWDWDVELAVFSEIAIKELDKIKAKSTDSGFEAKIIDSSIGNLKINLHKYDTKYTIVGLYKKKEYRLRKSFKYPAKFFDNATSIHFLGKNYLAPAPTDEFLSFIYGSDWMVPKMSLIKEEYLSKKIFNYTWGQIIKRFIKKYFFSFTNSS